jgi:hypothetical protein
VRFEIDREKSFEGTPGWLMARDQPKRSTGRLCWLGRSLAYGSRTNGCLLGSQVFLFTQQLWLSLRRLCQGRRITLGLENSV